MSNCIFAVMDEINNNNNNNNNNKRDFALFQSIQTCSGTHPAIYPIGTGSLSSGPIKQPGA
jgi:hypothetical protein